MESTGILVSTSRPADNVHLAPSICNAPVRFLESRSLSSGQSKSQSQKRTLVQPIPQTLSFSSPARHRNLFRSTARLPLQRESRKGESDCDRETQRPSKITERRTRFVVPVTSTTSSLYLPTHFSSFFPFRNTRRFCYRFRAIEFSFPDVPTALWGQSVSNSVMLELCDIYSRWKECPYTQETGIFRSLAISCTVKSSVWFSSLSFITVAPCCEMLRGQNTLRGHRAVGLERPHELLCARKRAQKGGRSSPIRCFVRAQMDRRAMRNFFYCGLFRKS